LGRKPMGVERWSSQPTEAASCPLLTFELTRERKTSPERGREWGIVPLHSERKFEKP